MRLERIDDSHSDHETSEMAPTKKGKVLYYRNPMRADVHSPVPAKDEMGMDYIPVYENEDAEMGTVAGQGVVKIRKGTEQQIGVAVSVVEKRDLYSTVKAPSRVAYDPGLYSAILEYQETLKNQSQGSAEGQSESGSTVREIGRASCRERVYVLV